MRPPSADAPRQHRVWMRFAIIIVATTVMSGCGAADQADPAGLDDVAITASDQTSEALPTTADPTSTPCTPAPTSTPTTTTTATATTATTSTSTTAPTTTTTTTTTTTATSTTTTAIATTTSTTPSDPLLAAQQQRLSDLGYWLGAVDGRFGSMTAHAVTAFQKAEGLPRTGELDATTVERLAAAVTPPARSESGTVLEVDLAHQILLVAVDGTVTRIYDIATGASATPTPAGRFEIYNQIDGYRHAPLGTLYRPKYFNGGIALHGYTSVPTQPASHGCVRLTYPAMDDLWASGRAPLGTPVWVY